MASWKNSIVIHAPADKVFAYVDEPMGLPTWIPNMVEVRNVIGTGAGQQFEWTFKIAGLLLRGQTVVVEHVPSKHVAHQVIGTVDALLDHFVEHDEEGTVLAIEVTYTVPVPVLGRLAEHIAIKQIGRQFDAGLENIKDLMEA